MTKDEKTIAKTLWSETILEILYASLSQNKSDVEIMEILKEVRQKGFKRHYILEKVEGKVDKQASVRINNLLNKQ